MHILRDHNAHGDAARHRSLLGSLGWLCLVLTLGLAAACSEEEALDEQAREFSDWQARNDAFFLSLDDSLRRDAGRWVKLKNISLDPLTDGAPTDYVYALKLDSAAAPEQVFAKHTDSVRISYEGRLMPSGRLYPDGMVYASTVFSQYDSKTNATAKYLVSAMPFAGWQTAVQHMRKGDYWRIYVPYDLGYGSAGSGKVPAYSTLIIDMTLVDISPAGQVMAPWSARRR